MDFDLTDEQRMLKDSVEGLITDRYDFEQRKKYMKEEIGFSRALWTQYAEMGLLGLPFEERFGGVGGGAVETMIVMEAFGRGLVLEPYLATVVLGGGLVNLRGNDAQRAAILPKIADGSLLLAFAHSEAQSRNDLADVATTATRDADGWILDGTKSFVAHGNCADKLIVSARISGGRNSRDGIGLFLVDTKTQGVSRKSYETQDGQRAAQIKLSGVKVSSNDAIGNPGDPGKALPLIERVADGALAAVAAEAVGAMAAAQEVTMDYLRTRKQFGVAIGSFQALQHRAVDILVSLEQARSMALFATMMMDDPDPAERSKAISAATVQIRRSGKFVGQQVVQLHGGIGMTLEYKIGHYFKRLTAMESLLGDTDHHLAALARAGGLIAASA